MLNSLLAVAIVLTMVGATQCHENNQYIQTLAQRVREFSLELLYHTSKEFDNHLVISPFQVWCLMTAVAQGADGRSYDQLRTALNLPSNRTVLLLEYKKITNHLVRHNAKGVTVQTRSFIFFDQKLPLEDKFKKIAKEIFKSTLIGVDIKDLVTTAAIANSLISHITEGRVPFAFEPADFEAPMILSNAINFKGIWTVPFDPTMTKREPFYNDELEPIGEVNMMFQRASHPFASIATLKGFVLELTYGEHKSHSMLVFLPHRGVTVLKMFLSLQKIGISEILGTLNEETENFDDEEVQVWMPRFEMFTSAVLNKPFNDMGVVDIFDPREANFQLASASPLWVSTVTQNTVLQVTEAGTTSSSVASAILQHRTEPARVKINRPFVYLIVEKSTATVLFGGVYSKPTLF